MKKILLLAFALLSVILLPAQGIYQLWGMTPSGGENNLGVIYNTNANGNNFRLKHNFNFTNSGSQPQYTQLVEYNNKFYGMTQTGGTNNSGIIFEWNPATNNILKRIDFTGINGMHPFGSLTLQDGKFYGMTQRGGANDAGVIFEWDPSTNIYTKKIDLIDTNGAHPQRDLVYSNGKFYGTTYDGGTNNFGVIFQWNPVTNVYTKLLDFDGINGGHTYCNLIAMGNKIYGLASGDGSGEAIFEWDILTGEYTRRLEFDFYNTGLGPQSLTEDGGKLYGLNVFYGFDDQGNLFDKGMIFEWDPSTGQFIKKIELDDISYGETGNLIKSGNKFYGTISGYLGLQSKGSLFEWDPVTNVYTKKFDFDGSNGANPLGMLTTKNGQLYGMTSAGGAYGWEWDMLGYGVIFHWDPITNIYNKKIDFEGVNGATHPIAGLTFYKSKLYGRAGNGGDNYSLGQIFEFDPELNLYSKKTTFGGGYDNAPCSDLTLNKNKFYGMTTGGGGRGYGGSIFEWDPVTNNYGFMKGFGWPSKEGYFPHGSLTAKDGILYGMTTNGGQDWDGFQSNDGVLFSWKPDSTNPTNPENYNPIFSFSNPSGSNPYGSLTVKAGKLYGMTSAGGDHNKGVIFEYELPPAYSYTKKIDFDSANGAYPKGSLTLVNGKFYGVTSAGGSHNAGVIFEWDPTTNIYQKKYDFDGINSSNPSGNLTYSDGKFYGVCFYGKPGYGGLIYEWDPVTNIFTDKLDFNGANGAFPDLNDLTLAPAPVAKGLPGSCKTLPSITINSNNNNKWVSITDEENNAVAEIKANGNNLGIVTASMFINNAAVRQDGTGRLYLDRSITITPQFPQKSPVDIRLYIKGTEYTALKNAHNSFGQTAGIESINDVGIFKINGVCAPLVSTVSNLISTTGEAWENDYVLSASINSFTSFCFASKNPCAAPVIAAVSASTSTLSPADHQMKNVTINYSAKGNCFPITTWLTVTSNEPVSGTGSGDLSPDWIIIDDHHLQLRSERSVNGTGRIYTITVNAKNAFGTHCKKTIKVVVTALPVTLAKAADGNNENGLFDCRVIPNPANNYFNLQIESASGEKIEVNLFDISGRLISKMNTVKDKTFRFGEDLKPGVYMVEVRQGEQQQIIKVIKQ